MEQINVEALIRIVTEKVLEALARREGQSGSQVLPVCSASDSSAVRSVPQKAADPSFEGRLLTDEAVAGFLAKGCFRIVLKSGTLVTPLARDRAKEGGLEIHFSSDTASKVSLEGLEAEGKCISLLASRCSRSEEQAIIDAAKKAGYVAQVTSACTATSKDFMDAAMDCAKAIRSGRVCRAVVLDENGYSVAMRLGKLDGIRPAVCWDLDSACASRRETDANVLVLSNRLLGLTMLKKIVGAWLNE